jgi:hypothetical protein
VLQGKPAGFVLLPHGSTVDVLDMHHTWSSKPDVVTAGCHKKMMQQQKDMNRSQINRTEIALATNYIKHQYSYAGMQCNRQQNKGPGSMSF